MADISMCEGTDCPLKENCYRYKATPCPIYQTYFVEVPYDHETNDCQYFWDRQPKPVSKKEEDR